MEIEEIGRGATSAFSSGARVPMDVDTATAKGPSTTAGATPIPRELANDILAAIPLLPDEWPLAKIDLIVQNSDEYYMSWNPQTDGLNHTITNESNSGSSNKKEGQCKPPVNQDVVKALVATSNVDSLFTHKDRLAKVFQTNAKFSQAQHFQIHSDDDDGDDVQIMDYKSAPQSNLTTEHCKIILECSKVLTKVPHADKFILLCQEAIQTWPLLFLNENHEMLKQAGACYLAHFAATMCYAMTALRILSYAPWTEDHMKGHIREIALVPLPRVGRIKHPKYLSLDNELLLLKFVLLLRPMKILIFLLWDQFLILIKPLLKSLMISSHNMSKNFILNSSSNVFVVLLPLKKMYQSLMPRLMTFTRKV